MPAMFTQNFEYIYLTSLSAPDQLSSSVIIYYIRLCKYPPILFQHYFDGHITENFYVVDKWNNSFF